ncbi:hypothetical protein DDB_G0281903 [Dictyostelium discoideum AX4]|uniref:EamA domain-containing protein n=1 Tax=Dictyostelium discoideum TaxID=44689 RepID=Q54T99_DICDI|nr:hypothetical protein DDB_G0281903 [Dictyostelium discoideum AX4]EAL66511.1 hypothetical protein DDB_G0281903 [Dictyostelium discoideum AX4]|eukprot:XP_640490.1 hypothetical protein DDB_G0281903 [Dictyostelium discoideum AX4]
MTPNRSPSITTTIQQPPNSNTIDPNVIPSSQNKLKIDFRAISIFSLFLFSGVANTLLVQLIYNNISFNPKSMLTNICIFLGYALLSLFKDPTKNINNNNNNTNININNNNINNTLNATTSPINSTTIQLGTSTINTKKQNFNHIKYILLALFDCLASLLTTIGQIAVGSGLFQVLFSSKIIFAAILTRFYLKSYVSPKKWISILTIFSGLCIAVFKISSHSVQNNDDTNNSYLYFGTFCVLFAAFVFSASHIFAESAIKAYDLRPYAFAAKYGTYSVIVCVFYILTVTFYNRKEWIEIPIEQTSSSDIKLVLFLFMILMITSVVRSSSMYTVLAEHGTVSMGVLYALQSIIVFFSSAFFLCDPNHPTKQNQCLSPPKLLGSIIVIFGVFMYNKANNLKQTQHIKI